MILKGSQRGGARALALHLLNEADNDHVEVHSVNGFIADDVEGAFQEIDAIRRATRCRQFIFSLSLSPPQDALVSDREFEDAIHQAMERLGLAGQPHVIIFHEKNSRRHCHVVISRIDTDQMKAINLSFFKDRLCELSRELYLTHGWELPKGHQDGLQTNPLNYSLEEDQVAKRAKRNPKQIKAALQDCWQHSDSKAGFAAALLEQGFVLCRGDRRGFVAVDRDGNIYSLSRWLGVKTKELKARLGNPDQQPDVETALARLDPQADNQTSADQDQLRAQFDAKMAGFLRHKQRLKDSQRQERIRLHEKYRAAILAKIEELRTEKSGLKALWQWASGKRQEIVARHKIEMATLEDAAQTEMMFLSKRQRDERRDLQTRIDKLQDRRDAQFGIPIREAMQDVQPEPVDPEERYIADKVRKQPEFILDLISEMKARFTRNDILRGLAKYIAEADERLAALSVVLQSDQLAIVEDNEPKIYATHAMIALEDRLSELATKMAKTKAYGVRSTHLKSAIQRQNNALHKTAGATLSEEQRRAIAHVVNRRQLSVVIGLAGAGKSTMLDAAREAWERQGYRVIGAALAGKAAEGLQNASGIPSRTLASYELSWKNGRNLLQPGDVLVIDEASMIGTRQMSRFIEEAHKCRAKIVLVGDPDQLQPINAGTPFRDIANKTGNAELTEIRRQKSEWQRHASLDLARGRIAEAMAAYESHGAIQTEATHEEAITALIEDYMADWELNVENVSRLALAQRRVDVQAINKGIRAARKSAGELQDEVAYQTDHGSRNFAPGDRILFTRNDGQLGVKNGMRGLVISADQGELEIHLEASGNNGGNRRLSVPLNRYSALDHGYATTIHKAQGTTVDKAFVLGSRTLNENLQYVAMTRHRTSCQIYLSSPKARHLLNGRKATNSSDRRLCIETASRFQNESQIEHAL